MKRIFKLTTVFALAGAVLLSGSCTKDYGEEIASVKKDLQTLTDGTVATHTSQIAAINSEIEKLKAMDQTLKTAIEKVETDYKAAVKELKEAIDKKATESAIVALQDRCTALESASASLTSRVTANENDIKALQSLVATKADSSWVDLTFATKEALANVAKDLGALKITVDGIDAAYKKADLEIIGELDEILVDINNIKDDISKIQGDIEDLWKYFDNYYQKGKIDEMINTLDGKITSLKSELEQKIAAEEQARQEEDSLIYVKIADEVKFLQNQIDVLTKDVIPALLNEDTRLQGCINDVQKNLDNEILARMAKDKVLQDSIDLVITMYQQADQALQNQIDELKKYSIEGDSLLNAKIETEIQDRIDAIGETKEEIANTKNELLKYIDIQDNKLYEDLNKRIDKEIGGRIESIADLQKKIDEIVTVTIPAIEKRIESLEADVTALAVRPTSIVIKPQTTPEIIRIKAGAGTKDSVRMIRTQFTVEPSEAADYIYGHKEGLELLYSHALPRSVNTKAVAKDNVAEIIDIQHTLRSNLITVIAKDLDEVEGSANVFYFTIKFAGVDDAGAFSIQSDYVQALVAEKTYDITLGNFFKIKKADDKVVDSVGRKAAPIDSLNYKQADTAKYYPFAGAKVVFTTTGKDKVINSFFENGKEYTPEEVKTRTNLNFDYSRFTDRDQQYPIQIEGESGSTGIADFYITFKAGESKSLFDYVTEPYTTYYGAVGVKVNDKEVTRYTAGYKITRVHHAADTMPALNLYWNYRTYEQTSRMDTIAYDVLMNNTNWRTALTAEPRAKAVKEFGDFKLSSDIKVNLGVWNKDYCDYNGKIVLTGIDLANTKPYSGNFEMVKKSNSDYYTFVFPVSVDTVMAAQGAQATISIPGTITKSSTIKIADYSKSFICDKNGNIKPALIHGLTGADATLDAIQKAFKEGFEIKSIDLSKQGDITDSVKYHELSSKDTLSLVVDPGVFNYNRKNMKLTIFAEVFGVRYTFIVILSTEAPKFAIATLPYVGEKDSIAPVRGAIKDQVYVIDDISYNQHVILTGLDAKDLNEDPEAVFSVKYTYSKEPKTGSGNPEVVTDRIPVDKTNGRLGDALMTWNEYTGTKVTLKAQVYVNDTPVDSCWKTYYVKTDVPVEFYSEGKIDTTKAPAKELAMVVTKNAKVYGIENGDFNRNLNLVGEDGLIKDTPYYAGTKFVFGEMKTIAATVEGKSMTFTKDIDYTWDEATATLTMTSDNVYGKVSFDVPVTLQYYLDYDHTKAITKNIRVTYTASKPN